MSYLSTTENVGFIPQNISETSCATQYKMAVEGAPAVCGEINNFINDSSGDEQPFINENYFHTKFKIDPNELYTFHDSDVIAGEITVSHTEDNYMVNDNSDYKKLRSPRHDVDFESSLPNGVIKEEIKQEVVTNGHCKQIIKSSANKDVKTLHTKVQKVSKNPGHLGKELNQTIPGNLVKQLNVTPKSLTIVSTAASTSQTSTKASINSLSWKHSSVTSVSGSETFLDVFKREQRLSNFVPSVPIKTEPGLPPPPPPPKTPVQIQTPKKASSGKTSHSLKSKRGRGPTVHEALQRIPQRAIAVPTRTWHAPGDELFECGPLSDIKLHPFKIDASSSEDDEHIPNFGLRMGCVEEIAADTRGARLALRRAALRRQVAQASAALRLSHDHKKYRALANVIKKQVQGNASARLPTPTVNHLLALRGMPNILTSQERRQLRTSGWSGGDSVHAAACSEEGCTEASLPCAPHCLKHVTKATQRLYAACSAVFAGGGRCSQPLLPLNEYTLCAEHAWKRDNYDKISREVKPKKLVRTRVWPQTPRRAKRRRRAYARSKGPQTVNTNQSISELNVCSNSSAYDSSEDAGVGGVPEAEFIVTTSNANELEVEQVPPDDILDSAVLSQIPDEAFTEFFNQAEGSAAFAESSELALALEAVLDGRALDSLAEALPVVAHPQPGKMKVSSVGVEMSSGVSS